MEINKDNYLKKLFIDQATPALSRHAGGGEDLSEPLDEQTSLIAELRNKLASGGKPSGGYVEEMDVNFYDYDGTLLYSYTVAEAQALKELPPLPTQPGLICQGWNYDLETIKTYDKGANVGATYITDDGKTRLYIKIAADGRMDVPLLYTQTLAHGVTIDWGDGSDTETWNSTGNRQTSHTYASVGEYVISLDVADECTLGLGNASLSYGVMGNNSTYKLSYCNMLKKVEIGKGVTNIDSRALQGCQSLESITIPNGVTSIGYYAFYQCYSLKSIVIPNGATSIVSAAFNGCNSLKSIVIPNSVTNIDSSVFNTCNSLASIVIPHSVTIINSGVFTGCHSLASIVMPDSVTSIGSKAFYQCYSLTSIVIPNGATSIEFDAFYDCRALSSVVIPNSVTSIGQTAFYNCGSLSSIVIPNSVTSMGDSVLRNCYSLKSIVIPNSVTSIGQYAFNGCRALSSVVIHNGVTSIGNSLFNSCQSLVSIVIPDSVTSIGQNAFYQCYSLTSIVVPNSVTSIQFQAFMNCNGIKFYDFSQHESVPTLENTNAFNGIASDCEIRVPAALYDEWIAATNWSSHASKIVAV